MPTREEISTRFKVAESRRHKQQAQVAQGLLIARREGDKMCEDPASANALVPHCQWICSASSQGTASSHFELLWKGPRPSHLGSKYRKLEACPGVTDTQT